MELTIEQEDIDQGIAWNPEECAVSLAMRKKFGVPVAEVQTEYAWAGKKCYKLSPALTAFISDYDNGKEALPGTYQIWEEV